MRSGVTTLVLAALMLVAACGNPATNKSRAVTGEAAQVSPSQPVGGQKYLITPQHCKIEFTGSQVTGTHNGSFQKFSGEIDYAGNPETSRVSVTIETDSLTADDPKLTNHLKTADFFDVAKYPQAKFVSTAIKPGGEKGASHTVTGNLTLHGVTKAVTFPATIAATADAIKVDADFTINRKDFGITYAGPTDNLIRDDVVLKLTIHATKG
ncbi:MAG TPA: YceI family protein [Pyrinomonadaceae bacterium]|jgi:polyisoprenoid-binding protein YceI